ncbi:RNA polymerase sigma factor [Pendulispora albinea]|uniref:RNA polymerase sigma factor n=1 Tax=Pendulispora albinea TaxID=2741071 RepID=A0ABZ2LX18_9BACT
MEDSWKTAASEAMNRYACGSEEAFSELYDLLAPWLAGLIRRHTRDTALAEDMLQKAFMRIHVARRHFAQGAAVTPWAYAIVRSVLADTFRGVKRSMGETEAPPESPCTNAALDEIVGQRKLIRSMQAELANMPEAQQAAFELVFHDGLSTTEAAQALGTSEAAVRLRIHRIRERLRHTLGGDFVEELGALA